MSESAPAEKAPPSVVALVKVGWVIPPSRVLTEGESLTLRARYAAGVQSIASGAGAKDVVTGPDWDFLVSFEGSEALGLARQAFLTAKLLRERVLLDLDLSARMAVHAVAGSGSAGIEPLRSGARETCERLLSATPEDAISVSPEVYLALPEADRRHLSPLVELGRDGVEASVFPAPAPQASGNLRESSDAKVRAKLRNYLGSSEIRRLRYVGFRLQKKEPPSLDILDVFVVPAVEVRKVPPLSDEIFAQMRSLKDEELRRELLVRHAVVAAPSEPVPFSEVFEKYKTLVILGDPGSGKTSLLKWLAVTGAHGPLALHSTLGTASHHLPLLASVGRLAELRATLGEAASTIDVMARYFRERNIEQNEAVLREFLAKELSEGRCLVLLDGLDEVRSESREGVMRWLEGFAAQFPANRFVATARQVGYVGLNLPDAAEVTLGPFEDEQVRRYVHSFHRAYTQWEEGSPDDVTADRRSERLLEALFANHRLHELSRNPFILSTLALIHRAEGTLPRHRVQAYQIFARALCETWGRARRIAAGELEGEQLRYEEEAVPILGRLALELHCEWPTGVAPEGFIVHALAKAIQERESTSDEIAVRSAREFLRRAGAEVQILLERGAGQWGFLHLTFQEFFAAMGLHAAEMFFEEGMAHLFESRWEEVLRLGVGYMALVQNRPEGVRRFIQTTLDRQESGPRRFITDVLKKQIPLAALFAVEAGDSLPSTLQDRIATVFSEWLCAMPQAISAASFGDIRFSDFASRLIQPLMRLAHNNRPRARAQAIYYLGQLKALEASTIITAALHDEAPLVRAAAASAVAVMQLTSAANALELLLSDFDLVVSLNAESALKAIHPERASGVGRTRPEVTNDSGATTRIDLPSWSEVEEDIAPWVEHLLGLASSSNALERDMALNALWTLASV